MNPIKKLKTLSWQMPSRITTRQPSQIPDSPSKFSETQFIAANGAPVTRRPAQSWQANHARLRKTTVSTRCTTTDPPHTQPSPHPAIHTFHWRIINKSSNPINKSLNSHVYRWVIMKSCSKSEPESEISFDWTIRSPKVLADVSCLQSRPQHKS